MCVPSPSYDVRVFEVNSRRKGIPNIVGKYSSQQLSLRNTVRSEVTLSPKSSIPDSLTILLVFLWDLTRTLFSTIPVTEHDNKSYYICRTDSIYLIHFIFLPYYTKPLRLRGYMT